MLFLLDFRLTTLFSIFSLSFAVSLFQFYPFSSSFLLCIMQLVKSYFKQFVVLIFSIAKIWLFGLHFSSTVKMWKVKCGKYCE